MAMGCKGALSKVSLSLITMLFPLTDAGGGNLHTLVSNRGGLEKGEGIRGKRMLFLKAVWARLSPKGPGVPSPCL